MQNTFSIDFAGIDISIKTNYMAGQADGSVLVTYGDTVVIVTAVSLKNKREGVDFMPLTVDYQEMTFAAGKIPGGFFKREGRPNEREILTSRIIDRSLRPLFPKGYFHETQIVATLLSMDNENDPAVTALFGASVALEISDIPFNGPIAAIRVGHVDGTFVCNPSSEALEKSDFNLFIVGRKAPPVPGSKEFDINLVMLEGSAVEVEEDAIVDAINFGIESLRPVFELQGRVRQTIGKEKRVVDTITVDEILYAKVTEAAANSMKEAYTIARKLDRHKTLDWLREKVIKEVCAEDNGLTSQVKNILSDLERQM
jgi:polyribonucleotide nucleotidyltransferase